MSWPIVKIGDVSEQIRGVSYAKEDASLTPKDSYLPVLRANNITEFGLQFDDLVYVPASRIKQKQIINQHDVVIAASSGSLDVVGKAASALVDFRGGFGAFCKVLRPNSKIDPRYFSNYFQTKKYRQKISLLAAGANINNLKNEHLDNLEIPLPPLSEQRRIAAILDKAEALRSKRREAIAKLDQLLQSAFLDMFGDPLLNPKRLPARKLSYFYASVGEGTRCGPFGSALKKSDVTAEGVPLWNMDNISASGTMELPFRAWVSKEKAESLAAYGVKNGDILISRAGTVGKMCVVRADFEKSLMTTNLIRLRLGENLVPEFFVTLMTRCKGRVGRLQTGPDGSFTHMSTGVLDDLEFPYPPLEQQEKWRDFLIEVEARKKILANGLAKQDALLQSLQNQFFAQ